MNVFSNVFNSYTKKIYVSVIKVGSVDIDI